MNHAQGVAAPLTNFPIVLELVVVLVFDSWS
jgi:hypothetical protein